MLLTANAQILPFFLEVMTMLWTVLAVLLLLWAFGLGFGIAGDLIHLLLVVAVVVLVVQFLQGRRAPV
jgi:hypothetical protein